MPFFASFCKINSKIDFFFSKKCLQSLLFGTYYIYHPLKKIKNAIFENIENSKQRDEIGEKWAFGKRSTADLNHMISVG